MTRWSLVVDDQTDRSLRTYLGQQGSKKGDLSKFVEQAVLERLFNKTARGIKVRNESLDQETIMAEVDEAVGAVREDRS